MIPQKSKLEIRIMREAGRIAARVLDSFNGSITPGLTTIELDRKAEKIIRAEGGIPAFKGYKGFPANICTSINDVVVHGIPARRELKSGDIISVDVGVFFEGYYADAARTYRVGGVTDAAGRLIEVTKHALHAGIKEARAGTRLSNVSHAIQLFAESHGYSVVRALVGHGIGSKMHEAPEIPNFGLPNKGVILKAGMALAIEPMVNEGGCEVETARDGWSIITKDRSLSAHFEHTVLITKGEPEILTQWRKKKR